MRVPGSPEEPAGEIGAERVTDEGQRGRVARDVRLIVQRAGVREKATRYRVAEVRRQIPLDSAVPRDGC
jgi:hypothetical protein